MKITLTLASQSKILTLVRLNFLSLIGAIRQAVRHDAEARFPFRQKALPADLQSIDAVMS